MDELMQEQKLEKEVLESIFMENYADLATNPPSCMITVSSMKELLPVPFRIKFTFPTTYPMHPPIIDIPLHSASILADENSALLAYIVKVAGENVGTVMVFTLVEAAKDWLNENLGSRTNKIISDKSSPEQDLEKSCDSVLASANIEPVKGETRHRGKWNFVIGLVGKPSAGKSTFFNAATCSERATTAVHPFTTISPNFGQAFYTIEDPDYIEHDKTEPAYGKTSKGHRYIPVKLIDVAGLVPGASDGKGRGNRSFHPSAHGLIGRFHRQSKSILQTIQGCYDAE